MERECPYPVINRMAELERIRRPHEINTGGQPTMCVNRNAGKLCVCMMIFAVLLTAAMLCGESLGIQRAEPKLGYEDLLFDDSRVHDLNIIMSAWDEFIEDCADELYRSCSLVIDGERLDNVGIRAKGNTSLLSVRSMGSHRYSLKLELDYYQDGLNYHGLDKFSLNNMIQDYTYMKDYLSYDLMRDFGAVAPLCSYVCVKVNGDPWGLFLATEDIDESFIRRNYGPGTGALYKPDPIALPRGFASILVPKAGVPLPTAREENLTLAAPGEEGMPMVTQAETEEAVPQTEMEETSPPPPDMSGFDVTLRYTDDNPNSYKNIFGSAKTHVTRGDQVRLIRALKALRSPETIEDAISVDETLRLFVAHNYTVNNDSYTGVMIHNYYLYENKGKLYMIPWDYNIAFGGYQISNASDAVNDPIDTPLMSAGDGIRPMVDWMLQEPYISMYHQYFEEFLNIDIQAKIDRTNALITNYVASHDDPISFCSHEEYLLAVNALRDFCRLRTLSIRGQLDGTIPSTHTGQMEANEALIDSSNLRLSVMGTSVTR